MALPAANPSLYAAAIEGGYTPNAYLTDFHDPFENMSCDAQSTSQNRTMLARMGLMNSSVPQSMAPSPSHFMHPHLSLVGAMQNPYSQPFTQCGVPL